MKLGKHAVKVLAVFAVLFVIGFALKFLNLHEGFLVRVGDKTIDKNDYNKRKAFLNAVRNAANEEDLKIRKKKQRVKQARVEWRNKKKN